jgi:predicted methyltransferase
MSETFRTFLSRPVFARKGIGSAPYFVLTMGISSDYARPNPCKKV